MRKAKTQPSFLNPSELSRLSAIATSNIPVTTKRIQAIPYSPFGRHGLCGVDGHRGRRDRQHGHPAVWGSGQLLACGCPTADRDRYSRPPIRSRLVRRGAPPLFTSFREGVFSETQLPISSVLGNS